MSTKIIQKKLFGKRVREARVKANLTQQQLADKLDVSQNFLGDIERGVKLPSLEKLIQLSNLLKVSLDSLFADSLDNVLYEAEDIYYTDKQLAIMKSVIRTINENFHQ